MSTLFPTTIDSYSVLVDNVDNVVAAHPNDRADAVVSVETKVGVTNSAVTTSHDYLLKHLPAQVANWDAGSFKITAETLESDVATGTAPLIVASTTVVTNLNADTVDGKHVAGTNGAGEITTNDGTQTLTGKTLTSPTINSPTLTTPTLGVATATTINKVTITAPASGSTLTIQDGYTLTADGNGSVKGTNTGDQTNISGNAATVTTNASLSGAITSVGNTTSIGSQTGTGTKFVVDTSPTITTPTISGQTTFSGTQPLKSIYLDADSASIAPTSSAALIDFAGANFTYKFLVFPVATDKNCCWLFNVPDNFTGSTVTITVYWTALAGTATNGVSWNFDSGGFANDEAFNTGVLGGTAIEVEDALIALGDMHVATSGAFTCDWTAGDMAVLKCWRDVDGYSGTGLTGDVLLLGVKIEYSISTLGE